MRAIRLYTIIEEESNPWRKAEKNLLKESEENHKGMVRWGESEKEDNDGDS